MRRHTRWLYKINYSNGTIRVGHYYNANPKCDTIRFRHVKDGEVWWDIMIRADEAILMAAGLVHVAGDQLYATKRKQYKAAGKAARTRAKKRRIGH